MTAAPQQPSVREKLSEYARKAARLFFAAAVVLTPFRLRTLLVVRPQHAIPADYSNFLLFSPDLAVAAMLTFWTISLIALPRRLKLGPRALWIPLAGLTLVGWTSTISSLDAPLSVYHAIRLLGLFWFYLYVVNEISLIRWVLIPVGVQVLIQSIVALGQFVMQHSLTLQLIGELYLDPARNGVSIVTVDGLRLLRPYGLTDHPNILGGCLAFGMLLLLPTYLEGTFRWAAFAVLLPAGAALLITFSRSSWFAFLTGTVVLILVHRVTRQPATLKPWLWLGVAWLVVLIPIVLGNQRFFGVRLNAGGSFSEPTAERQSIGERLLLIRSSMSIIADHPLLGVGLGTAPLALKLYQPDWSLAFEPPHFALLEAAEETGLPGAAFYLALVVAPFVMYFRQHVGLKDDAMKGSVIALLLSITMVGFFDYYTWLLEPGRLWQWLSWALWAAVSVPGSRVGAALSRT